MPPDTQFQLPHPSSGCVYMSNVPIIQRPIQPLSLFARALLRLLLIDPIMILQEKELDVGNRCK